MNEVIFNISTNETTVIELSDEEIAARIVAEEARIAAIPYTKKRLKEYPSFADQFDLLYHGGYDAWKAAIQAVKNKYPKPDLLGVIDKVEPPEA
jgi:hypothetical protein